MNPVEIVLMHVSSAELARRLKVTRQAITLWKSRGRIPAERVLAVERLTGVPRTMLRPDLYPPEG